MKIKKLALFFVMSIVAQEHDVRVASEKSADYVQDLCMARHAQQHVSLFYLPEIHTVLDRLLVLTDNQADSFLSRLFHYAQRVIPLIVVQLLFLLFLMFLVLYSGGFVCVSSRVLKICSGVAGCLFLMLMWYNIMQNREYGIVVHDQAGIFAGPQVAYHCIESCKAGKQIEILQESSGWYKVKAGKIRGWIESSAVKSFKM